MWTIKVRILLGSDHRAVVYFFNSREIDEIFISPLLLD